MRGNVSKVNKSQLRRAVIGGGVPIGGFSLMLCSGDNTKTLDFTFTFCLSEMITGTNRGVNLPILYRTKQNRTKKRHICLYIKFNKFNKTLFKCNYSKSMSWFYFFINICS